MGNFTNSSYAPLAPFIKNEFILNEASVGLITSVTFAGAMSVALFSGLLVDYLGPRKTLKISYAFLAAGAAGAFLANGFYILIASYFVVGFGYGMITPATNSAVMTEFYPHHASPMGIKQSGVPLGTMLAAFTLSLIALRYSLRASFLSLVAVSFIILLLIRSEKNFTHEGSFRLNVIPEIKHALKSRTLILISAVTAFLSWGQQSVFTYFVLFMNDRGFYVIVSEHLFIILLAGSFIGRIAWPVIGERLFGGHRIKNYAFIIVLIGLSFIALPFFARSLDEAVLMAFFMGFTSVAWNSNYVTIISEAAPKGSVGMYTGLSLTFISLGAIVGAPLSGLVIDTTGTFSMMWFLLGTALMIVSVSLIILAATLLRPVKGQKPDPIRSQ